jgi:hypothetical protein
LDARKAPKFDYSRYLDIRDIHCSDSERVEVVVVRALPESVCVQIQ